MSSSGVPTQTDSEFERSLLESAQADGPSQPTHEAWAKLCASLAPLQAATQPEALQPSAASPAARARFSPAHAAAWLTLGGVGGALVTALWLGAWAPAPAKAPPPEPPAPIAHAAPAPAEPAPTPPPLAAIPQPPREPTPARKPAPAPPKNPAPERSSLSAEVAALDRANASLRGGHFEAALRAVEQYRRDFPRGVLARDAEMIAIDALEGSHDTTALAQRAREFLTRYPSDPHAPRVRSLLRAAH